MKCQNRHKEFLFVTSCMEEASKKITITTFVPHLGNQKQVRVRCLCTFHAKRYRNKLNYEINELHKNKSYVEVDINL